MTTDLATKKKAGGLRWFVDSMWGFWLMLLAISFAAAIAIYYLWMHGRT